MYQQPTFTLGGSAMIFNSYAPQPTANITKNRGRLKAYGKKVYLKNGSNFEIELHNPKTTPVLAKIWINGKPLSESGLILKPGQRVYLERFIDHSKKFVFETYEVDNTAEAKRAIADNGKVLVCFYDETVYQAPIDWQNPPWNTDHVYYGNPTVTTGSPMYSANTAYLSSSSKGVVGSTGPSGVNGIQMEETGRVEMGEASNQKFNDGFGSFNSWTCATSEWQILPESQKPVDAGEIRSYCTGCGTRHKKSSWKFCPNCGTSVNS